MRFCAALSAGRRALPSGEAVATVCGRKSNGPGGLPLSRVAVNGLDRPGELLLRVRDLRVEFGPRAAVWDVEFDLYAGETLGLVGESGSGKSTLARAILRLVRARRGSILWCGQDLRACGSEALRRLRRDLQIVFQDPLASLDPRMTIGESIGEPLQIFEPKLQPPARKARISEMLERVGLSADMIGRYPHEFSGGQCQRIGIARAMILRPRLLICDEPVSSLDVSIQGQIVNLLLDLQRDAGTAMLFISHNLALVRHLSHRVLVMFSGTLVETAARDELFNAPIHPYTRTLLAADPPPPVMIETPTLPQTLGCSYRQRCGYAVAVCAARVPPLEEVAPGHAVACHRARELMSDP
jgi:oligopeptide transport system ATP-binding protein